MASGYDRKGGTMLITPKRLRRWGACYEDEQILELFAGRESLTPLEILELPIPSADALWVVLRRPVIPTAQLSELGCRFAEAVLPSWSAAYPHDTCLRDALTIYRQWMGEPTLASSTAMREARRALQVAVEKARQQLLMAEEAFRDGVPELMDIHTTAFRALEAAASVQSAINKGAYAASRNAQEASDTEQVLADQVAWTEQVLVELERAQAGQEIAHE